MSKALTADHYRPDLLVVNVPEWFEDPEFLEVLNDPEKCLMTWHHRGEAPNEYSDVMLMVDPGLSGEGPEDGTIPDRYWDQIVELCRSSLEPSHDHHVLVKLTNLPE